MATVIIIFISSYLLGSLSSAILVSRSLGLPDPRSTGSNNPGATNMLRIGGKKAAIITLLGDLLKGLIPVVLAGKLQLGDGDIAAAGLGAFFGHLYPLYFSFQGGKGVATFIGVLFGFTWLAGVIFMTEWCLVAYLFRYSSLAALVSAVSSVGVIYWLTAPARPFSVAALTMVAMLLWRHWANIRRLLDGTEAKIGIKVASDH